MNLLLDALPEFVGSLAAAIAVATGTRLVHVSKQARRRRCRPETRSHPDQVERDRAAGE
ncbi:hypothetical protein [Streptomyces sp. NPDC057238]|uniref:hypothetical protein n=1 Tax=Streptomyces sp. NPDC057238 TaxID=3346060 RepID=UPI00363E013A